MQDRYKAIAERVRAEGERRVPMLESFRKKKSKRRTCYE